jgi:glyoxylase I family protein
VILERHGSANGEPDVQITHTHHIALLTPDFARCRDFYVNTLGLPLIGGFPGRNIIFVDAGSTAIEIVENTQATPATATVPWNHLALEVADVDAAYAALSTQGVPFHVAPKDFPEEAPSVRIAFFKDPDGNVLELVQPLGSRYPQP